MALALPQSVTEASARRSSLDKLGARPQQAPQCDSGTAPFAREAGASRSALVVAGDRGTALGALEPARVGSGDLIAGASTPRSAAATAPASSASGARMKAETTSTTSSGLPRLQRARVRQPGAANACRVSYAAGRAGRRFSEDSQIGALLNEFARLEGCEVTFAVFAGSANRGSARPRTGARS
jgi:hypothetical protein